MVYRDMTFCSYKDCLDFNNCHRALTDKVIKDANNWWGDIEGEAPICQWTEQPDCFKDKE